MFIFMFIVLYVIKELGLQELSEDIVEFASKYKHESMIET